MKATKRTVPDFRNRAEEILQFLRQLQIKRGRPLTPREMTAAIRKAGLLAIEDEETLWHLAAWPKLKRLLKRPGDYGVPEWEPEPENQLDEEDAGWTQIELMPLEKYAAAITRNLRSTESDLAMIRLKIRYFTRRFGVAYLPPADLNLSLELTGDDASEGASA